MRIFLSLLFLASCTSEPASDLSGEFVPTFEDAERAEPAIEIERALGWYERLDGAVWVSVDITWRNTDDSLASFLARINLPFVSADEYVQSLSGSVRLQQLDDIAPAFVFLDGGTMAEIPSPLDLSLDIVSDSLVVVAALQSPAGPVALAYGTGYQRLVASVVYVTNE